MADVEEDERPDDGRPPEVVFSGGAVLMVSLGAAGGESPEH